MKDPLIAQAHHLKPIVQIGKDGLSDGLIDMISHELKERELIKVKFLKNAEVDDKKEFAQEVAQKTQSRVVQVIGHTIVLYKKRE